MGVWVLGMEYECGLVLDNGAWLQLHHCAVSPPRHAHGKLQSARFAEYSPINADKQCKAQDPVVMRTV